MSFVSELTNVSDTDSEVVGNTVIVDHDRLIPLESYVLCRRMMIVLPGVTV